MKRKLMVSVAASMLLALGCSEKGQSADAASEVELKTLEQRVSYIFGLNLGQQFKQDNILLDVPALTQALHDVRDGKQPRLSQEEIQLAMKAFQDKQQAASNDARQVVATANQKEGEAFLEANTAKEGVMTTESGLQYKVVRAGTGPKPTLSDTVSVHYRGTLIDGTEFDSSYSRGEPVSFPLAGVIPGWTEGLQLMQEGGKWEFYIPSSLAYGPGGTSGSIGPNATLIFEVELLKAKVN